MRWCTSRARDLASSPEAPPEYKAPWWQVDLGAPQHLGGGRGQTRRRWRGRLTGGVPLTGWRLVDPDLNVHRATTGGAFSRQLIVDGVRATRARGPDIAGDAGWVETATCPAHAGPGRRAAEAGVLAFPAAPLREHYFRIGYDDSRWFGADRE